MELVAGGVGVLLTEKADGLGGGEGVEGLGVEGEEGGVEVDEVVVDALSHEAVGWVEREIGAAEEECAEVCEVALDAVVGDAVGYGGDAEGVGHEVGGESPLAVEEREERAEEDEGVAWGEGLVGVGDEVGSEGEFLFVEERGRKGIVVVGGRLSLQGVEGLGDESGFAGGAKGEVVAEGDDEPGFEAVGVADGAEGLVGEGLVCGRLGLAT